MFNSFNIEKLKNHSLFLFITKNQKYAPLLCFIGGFLWDWLTLGRVDRLYDMILLSAYFFLLSLCLYLYNSLRHFNRVHKYIKKYKSYLPLAIQFFLGGLTSAYVIYFSRSVSLSKTSSFFVILILLFFANEIFKKRISNLHLQFGMYAFVSFTFFAYMIPVLMTKMNSFVFFLSGCISLGITISLIRLIYFTNNSLKTDVSQTKLLGLVVLVYAFITTFYVLKLIPPVPLALNESIVSYDIEKEDNSYKITFESDRWNIFWRGYKKDININNTNKIYVFTSIFAPTDLNKKVYHLWKKYNPVTETWEETDKIGFTIIGGRKNGFRGYTFKENIVEGDWEVEVITEEGLLIGVVDFSLINKIKSKKNIKTFVY